MDDKELKKGIRNAWLLAILLIGLVAAWTIFTIRANQPGVEPSWAMGNREFVPGESRYALDYQTPKPDETEARSGNE